ncbi:hypothetical protein PYCCODRAFT_749373 [Trametes coccinea BRFM310]|uniref:Uncharacterized protein n=1 Tax=Trametes coccinea (strain BRFM310) TaxID=1353009 RepID=A0A1Y2IIP4_TRAC3|nr:hypothetical protein PYCCODRAFT_749373 [Trametes coccinea BRFM310]
MQPAARGSTTIHPPDDTTGRVLLAVKPAARYALFSFRLVAAARCAVSQPGVTRTHGAHRRPVLAGVLVLLAQHVVEGSLGCPAAREDYRSTRLVESPCATRVLSGALGACAIVEGDMCDYDCGDGAGI